MGCFQLLYMLVGVRFITSVLVYKNHSFSPSEDLITLVKF